MGLSQYHTTLAHVTPRERPHTLMLRVHYGNIPSCRGTQAQAILPQLTPSRRGTSPPSQVQESTPCVCISMSLSNPNHTIQVCLRNTHVFQTSKTRKLTTVTTGSSELIGRRPAYQSGLGRPNSSDVDPPINLAVLACTRV